jgi:hypothetical protein
MFGRLPAEATSGVGGISLRMQLSLSRPVVDGIALSGVGRHIYMEDD